MKKVGEIYDLPLIAINEGIECGKIKEFLVNPDNGKLEYLIIADGQWYLGAKLLSFDKIVGIGNDAVTTDTISNVREFGEVEGAIELAKKNIKIIGAKCYTQKGKFVGIIKEYYINEKDGTVTSCELETNGMVKTMLASSIITFGKDVLIAADNVDENLEHGCDDKKTSDNPVSGTFATSAASGASNLFEQKQIQFLLGKKASKRIVDLNGNVLIDKGEIVTEESAKKVKACGKLVELIMNISS